MVGIGWCSQVRASSDFQFDALREVAALERQGHCRGETVSALLGGYASDSARQGWSAARSSTSQGSAEPLCVGIIGANREVSEEKDDF